MSEARKWAMRLLKRAGRFGYTEARIFRDGNEVDEVYAPRKPHRRPQRRRRNPSRVIAAQHLHPGDVIEFEDFGQMRVARGPYRSARGVRIGDEYGLNLILQPNEAVRLVARGNPRRRRRRRRR